MLGIEYPPSMIPDIIDWPAATNDGIFYPEVASQRKRTGVSSCFCQGRGGRRFRVADKEKSVACQTCQHSTSEPPFWMRVTGPIGPIATPKKIKKITLPLFSMAFTNFYFFLGLV